ncbi:EAL domain-containing protein [Aquabacterium sp.]|uniref:bifunctional diguanylate cyclase/phosphodiesterase n=1 Tax=Aquabacterium sp. TaxID=1872578 RepID=UPI0035B26B81
MMFNLFSRFLARLTVGNKLLLIYLLDLSAVIYITSILINEKFIAIDFAKKEVQGVAYVASVKDTLLDLARSGAGEGRPSEPWAAHAQQLTQAEQAYGDEMHSADVNRALLQSLSQMKPAAPRLSEVDQALDRGGALLTRVGNQSNLILDPDLDSYYTMSLVVLRYPELLNVIHRIGVHLSQPSEVSDLRTQYLVLEGQLDAMVRGIASDYAEAVAAAPSPVLKQALEPSQLRLQQQVEAFRRAARELIDLGVTPAAVSRVAMARRDLVEALDQSWGVGVGQLHRMLLLRIDGLYTRMWLHLGTALTLLLTILTIVYVVAQNIRVPLRRLLDVADTVRKTGDYSLRGDWRSQDEIGRLVDGFNDMLAQLDRERVVKQELVASARAADAQRAFLESTPIPIVVTAVPGHEVLHANPPAQQWLNGRTKDPWAVGMDSAVRGRFFQHLADRGAVDEFEVQWKAGTEPTWAVLSARRFEYQGHDAVLTAFTPINHLKLMERRLELWAKVFESSTEGILIVDAQRCILSANQAFFRATGYDLHDVVGERPEFVLKAPDGEVDTFFDKVWRSAVYKGTWQGELCVRRRNGSEYPAWLMVSPVREAQGSVSHYIFTSIDISDRKKSEARIEFLAHHDVLTELPNRSLCVERLRMAMQQAERTRQRVAVLFIDLDRFKQINDSLGHHIGDGLLRSVAKRLTEAVRAGDTVSRQGGDEFVVVLNGVEDSEEVSSIVERRLIPLIRQPHAVEGAELDVSCSVGIALYPDDADDLDTLMRHADTAMYQAKSNGRNMAKFFSAEMTERIQKRLQLEMALGRALEAGQLMLHYQPRVDARSGDILGVEALLRWHHPEMGAISPLTFIPLAEEIGLIIELGAWVIEEACRQLAQWRAQGLTSLTMSVNLSAYQLRDPGLVQTLAESLARHHIPPHVLELELTESALMDGAEANLRTMHSIRALGVGLSVDDFGTGYSSLNYLNRFPLDKLKIDRSFVHDMLHDPTHRAITQAIIGLGHTLDLSVVAEGVETEEEAEALRSARCDELQGFLYSRPMPGDALLGWIEARKVIG